MSYSDFLDLRLAVSELVDNRGLSEVFPSLTRRAETRINRDLRVYQQIVDAPVTLVGGAADLPSDWIEYLTVKSGRCVYRPISTARFKRGDFGYIVAGTKLKINGSDETLDTSYYAKLPTISNSPTATNWLLDDGPDVYLYAVAREAAMHIRDAELRASMESEYQRAINEMETHNHRAKWGNARLRLTGATP